MVDFPDNVLELVKAACQKHKCDITKSTTEALRKVQSLPNYHQLIEGLVYNALRQIVYTQREQLNTELRAASKDYGAYAGKPSGAAESINQLHRNLSDFYDYKVGGKDLGDVIGEELIPLAEKLEATAEGHLFTAQILRDLRPLVRDGRSVREAVKPKKLKSIFEGIQVVMPNRMSAAS